MARFTVGGVEDRIGTVRILPSARDQALLDQGLDMLAAGRVEARATVDEVGTIALGTVGGLRHIITRAIRLGDLERPRRDLGGALERAEAIDLPVNHEEKLGPARREGTPEGFERHHPLLL